MARSRATQGLLYALYATSAALSTTNTNANANTKPFGPLALPVHLHQRLQNAGYHRPMPIQCEAMQQIASGNSTVIHSATGSGKTLAFLVPLLATMPARGTAADGVHDVDICLVSPSQELAVQLAAEAQQLLEPGDVQLAISPPGEGERAQRRGGARLVVGTPARLIELLRPERRRLGRLRALVLDEVDALLPPGSLSSLEPTAPLRGRGSGKGRGGLARGASSRGFRGRGAPQPRGQDLSVERRLAQKKPTQRLIELLLRNRPRGAPSLQVVSASATVDAPIRRGLGLLLGGDGKRGAGNVATASPLHPTSSSLRQRGVGGVTMPTTMVHSAYLGREDARLSVLRVALQELTPEAPLLVLPNGRSIPRQVDELRKAGFESAIALHEALGVESSAGEGDALTAGAQDTMLSARRKLADAFAQRAAPPLLVTTEQGARGVDLKGIDCVLLMGLPQRADAYVHVAGRTAREGRRGRAVSLIFSEQDEARLGEFKAELGIKVSSVDLKWLKPE